METIVTKDSMSPTDILDLFPGVEASDVLTKPADNILRDDKDISFLDKEKVDLPDDDDDVAKVAADAAKVKPLSQTAADKILDSVNIDEGDKNKLDDVDDDQGADAEGKGRPKTDKSAMASYLKTKIEKGDFSAFEDWDEKKETLEQYLNKQPVTVLHQMLDANWEAKEQALINRTPQEFFESLPPELQYAARYAAAGGKDFKKLFSAMSRVEETKSFDASTEEGQIAIARTYLRTIDYGSEEAIEDEIDTWKKTGKLEKKIGEFKPKLDQMQKQQVEYQIQEEEEWREQQQAAAKAYVGNVYKTLEKGEINGIKLDKNVQKQLYSGLTQASYPTASGKGSTNLLGHLLEKIQYVEPDFALLAEVTYHLMDPQGFRKSLEQVGVNKNVVDTVKKLKTERLHDGGAPESDDKGEDKTSFKKKLTKPANIFSNWK